MNDTFNLSERVHAGTMLQKYSNYYFQEDVKEAIKKVKEDLDNNASTKNKIIFIEKVKAILNNRFGKKLI